MSAQSSILTACEEFGLTWDTESRLNLCESFIDSLPLRYRRQFFNHARDCAREEWAAIEQQWQEWQRFDPRMTTTLPDEAP